jgi:periplasmic copper chaperone A
MHGSPTIHPMVKLLVLLTAVAALVVPAAILVPARALGAEFDVGNVQVINPWTRATPKGASVAGAYMTIRNKGGEADRLVGGSVEVAGRVELHKMEMDGGVARMRPVEGGLEIKPGESIELKPGSLHVMFVELNRPVQHGQKVKGTLEFQKSGKVELEYEVQPVGASAPSGGH